MEPIDLKIALGRGKAPFPPTLKLAGEVIAIGVGMGMVASLIEHVIRRPRVQEETITLYDYRGNPIKK